MKPTKLNLLVVEDSRDDARLIVKALEEDAFEVDWDRVDTPQGLGAALDAAPPDIILADYGLPRFTGLEALRQLYERGLDIPVIIVSGTIGEENAAELMRAGARDFIVKDRLGRLGAAVRRELAEAVARRGRRSAETELRMEQQRFRALVERSAEVITVLDRDVMLTYSSPSTRRVLGYGPEEFLGQSALSFLHADDVVVAREQFRQLVDEPGGARRFNFRFRHRDGTWLWMDVTATNLLDEPAVRGVVANFRDVTDWRGALDALEESEALYRATFDEAPIGIAHFALDGRVVRVNAEFARLVGYSSDELVRLDIDALSQPPERASERAVMAGLLQGRVNSSWREKQYVRKDGSTVWTSRTVSVRRAASGEPLHFLALVADIAERKEAERQVRSLRDRFEAILDHSPALIYLKDAFGRFVLTNRAFDRLVCRPGETAVGRTADDLCSPASAAAIREHDAAARAGVGPVARELELNAVDGPRVLLAHQFLLRDDTGGADLLGGIAIDLTDRKRIEQQLVQAQKMEAFGQLAGGVAHDFNNILAVLLMHFEMMPLEAELAPKTRATVQELQRVVDRATSLVRQLLIFSRKHEVAKQPLDLNRAVEEVCRVLQRFLGEDIAFAFQPSPAPVWVEADPGMVEQVVMNLCVNARDAMPHGGSLRVSIQSVRRHRPDTDGIEEAEFACIAVTDTGHGIDEATKRRIFEPFFTTKPVGRGTGLGLATVHGIARQHGGWVEVDSEPQRGSTFRVYFAGGSAPAAPALFVDPRLVRGSGRILLVEDAEDVRQAAASCLRLAGYEVVEARDATEAQRLWAEQGRFTVLLTDIVMPGGVTGTRLAELLLQEQPALKVVVMTGYSPGAPNWDAPHSPGIVRMTKPFSAAKLLEVVAELVGSTPAAAAGGSL